MSSKKLDANLPEIRERFSVETIGIGLPLREFVAFKRYLEELFGGPVDLVPIKWMDPLLRPYIEQDLILFDTGGALA